jgi:uncharacterized protein
LLENTFIHIPGVGSTIEKALWKNGCLTWNDALAGINEFSFGSAGTETAKRFLDLSIEALAEGKHQFFTPLLGTKEAWRAFPHFKHSCAYVDIETDGGKNGQAITTIGLYDGNEFEVFIKGRNIENFRDRISHFSMIVTFFGLGFDVPMLHKRFRDLQLDQIHVDLCPALRSIGIAGGLKKIEKQLGINRGEETDGLNGYDAVLLWRKYERLSDEKALDKLIAYNREDVVNLEYLANYAYNGLKAANFDQILLEETE